MNQNIIQDFENLCRICSQTNDEMIVSVALAQCRRFKDAFPNEKRLDEFIDYINYITNFRGFMLERVDKQADKQYNKFFHKNKKELRSAIPTFEAYKGVSVKFPIMPVDFLRWLENEFCMSLGNQFYSFHEKYAAEGRLTVRRPGCKEEIHTYPAGVPAGVMIPLNPVHSNSVVYINKFNDINDLMGLVHELGHAYFHYINDCGYMGYIYPQTNIKTEIASRMMELLFIKYLYSNGFKDYADSLNIQFSKIANYCQNSSDMINNYKYCLGAFLSQLLVNTIGNDWAFEEFLKFIHQTNYQDLLQICKDNKDSYEKEKVKSKCF